MSSVMLADDHPHQDRDNHSLLPEYLHPGPTTLQSTNVPSNVSPPSEDVLLSDRVSVFTEPILSAWHRVAMF